MLDPINPVSSLNTQPFIGSITDKQNEQLAKIVNSDKSMTEKCGDVLLAFKVTLEQRITTELETREQSSTYL